ncbi:transmembrane pair family protein [Bordetella holmesii CDC-H635-BH]|uniref:Transmembrane pair family protein n=2 Tax=Bordetella holmesii TaxID=35814 RepID=A0A158M3E2_9BORD|nr:transmembrane pair family protein [Bordetella holmesii H620]KAK84471.1 transmembrane pair family protein [Bordetella holmesii CDC-H809-BH]KAK85780.1 transmembrane pair family protein [Bordetella holmesii CDC-H572-BH]KAK88571.1 transmembrane pair family protein [Bordetella holmesii CDC-H585-BH]KAK95281.1 transmembrane pair family protein [Bordetella holmesii CDC-H635-BH]KCV01628.1 transmembrane pair family protein [Bordetella holmesii CDC-H719-BH]KCV03844.1 transmembrane pair family protein
MAMTQAQKTLKERFVHAFLFEILAIGLCAPVAAWPMGKSLFEMGVLTAVIAWIALLWNMLYNAGFDRLENRMGWTRTLRLRVVHALGFETGLILIVIPLAAWWLQISLWEAFVLDIALVLFYLPYAFFYNLAYDKARVRVLRWLDQRNRYAQA